MSVSKRKSIITHPFYLLFIFILSLLAIVFLGIEVLLAPDMDTRLILNYADFLMCIIFFFDFLLNLIQSEDKKKYFFTWGWIDLISSIPAINILRLGRIFRMTRIFRVFRAIKTTKIFSDFLIQRNSENIVLATLLIFIVFITISSLLILKFERYSDISNIKTAGDALWWSIVTITTVGYGDKYPVTAEGRILASFVMIAGVGLFGVISGLVASWILGSSKDKSDRDVKSLQKEIHELKETVLKMTDANK